MNPQEAIKHWEIGKVLKIRPVATGIFNETYVAHAGFAGRMQKYILQRLHPLISGAGPTLNYVNVTNFLLKRGVPAQEVVPIRKGKYLVKDGARAWRLLKAVPGHVFTVVKNPRMAEEAGRELGKVHLTLDTFKGKLKKTLPMFQYDAVLAKLKKYGARLKVDKNKNVSASAEFLLAQFPKYFLPRGLKARLIHTDPKISNFIFDDAGRAVAMIDLDTVQKLSPLYDLGDAIRSLCGGEEDDSKNKFDAAVYGAFMRGYARGSKKYLNAIERALIPRAAALVILGLSARFLNDYIDDNYFGWDSAKYKSRKAHNLARAIGQIALFKDFQRKMRIN